MGWDTWRGSKGRPAIAPASEFLRSWLRKQDKDTEICTRPLCDLHQVTFPICKMKVLYLKIARTKSHLFMIN